jgi:hypothetical protein
MDGSSMERAAMGAAISNSKSYLLETKPQRWAKLREKVTLSVAISVAIFHRPNYVLQVIFDTTNAL